MASNSELRLVILVEPEPNTRGPRALRARAVQLAQTIANENGVRVMLEAKIEHRWSEVLYVDPKPASSR